MKYQECEGLIAEVPAPERWRLALLKSVPDGGLEDPGVVLTVILPFFQFKEEAQFYGIISPGQRQVFFPVGDN